jgi:hypothetical protein
VQDGTYIIGRDDDVAGTARRRRLGIADPTVSQRHAELVILAGQCYLTDLGSRNGTFRLREGAPERFREGYVDPHEPLLFGERRCTLAELLADA